MPAAPLDGEPWPWQHKPLHLAETLVVAHPPWLGRFSGWLSALRVCNVAGAGFSIGTGFSDHDRALPPAPSQRIGFGHPGFAASGVLRLAS